MKGDFTRDTFDPYNHFSRVLMQQGRVTLDSDHNEQTSILLYYLRALARDLIGPYAAPVEDGGFELKPAPSGVFTITKGRYYVDGILIENNSDCTYTTQPDYQIAPEEDPLLQEINKQSACNFWIYLDVWERHITPIENDAIREKALNGPDTCTRSKVVWQVKALPISTAGRSLPPCQAFFSQLPFIGQAYLAAELDPGKQISDPCIQAPSSQYRGAENQLYRVEIHRGGRGRGGDEKNATFKWSRDNGSVATAWLGVSGNDLQVAQTRGFETGTWVELSDDVAELQGKPGLLVKVLKVDNGVLSILNFRRFRGRETGGEPLYT